MPLPDVDFPDGLSVDVHRCHIMCSSVTILPVTTVCPDGEKLVQVKIHNPEETSWEYTDNWEILDVCSGETVDSGHFFAEANGIVTEVCVDENGSYTFKISDLFGNGIAHGGSFDFNYSLRFNGEPVVIETAFNDGSDEVPFGRSLCYTEPEASGNGNANARHLRRKKQSKE